MGHLRITIFKDNSTHTPKLPPKGTACSVGSLGMTVKAGTHGGLTYLPDIVTKDAGGKAGGGGLGVSGPREGPHTEHEMKQRGPRQQAPCTPHQTPL